MLRYQEDLRTSRMSACQRILRERIHCNDKLVKADQYVEDAHRARPLTSRDYGRSPNPLSTAVEPARRCSRAPGLSCLRPRIRQGQNALNARPAPSGNLSLSGRPYMPPEATTGRATLRTSAVPLRRCLAAPGGVTGSGSNHVSSSKNERLINIT